MLRINCISRPMMGVAVNARSSKRFASGAQLPTTVSNGARCKAFFNFNKNKTDSAPTLTRDDFGVQEVEDYFNYMGMLAAEGTYDRLEKMLASGEAPVDLLLLMACSENDTPKVEEVLAAGADITRKDIDGRTPLELCSKEEIKEMLEAARAKRA